VAAGLGCCRLCEPGFYVVPEAQAPVFLVSCSSHTSSFAEATSLAANVLQLQLFRSAGIRGHAEQAGSKPVQTGARKGKAKLESSWERGGVYERRGVLEAMQEAEEAACSKRDRPETMISRGGQCGSS
jgi:hypothetical protein